MAVVTVKPGGTLEWLCWRCGARWSKDPLSMAQAASAYSSQNPRGVHRVLNYLVQCHTCRWQSPTRFMARKAAEVTAAEHQEDQNDLGVLWVDVMAWEEDLGNGLRAQRRLSRP